MSAVTVCFDFSDSLCFLGLTECTTLLYDHEFIFWMSKFMVGSGSLLTLCVSDYHDRLIFRHDLSQKSSFYATRAKNQRWKDDWRLQHLSQFVWQPFFFFRNLFHGVQTLGNTSVSDISCFYQFFSPLRWIFVQ